MHRQNAAEIRGHTYLRQGNGNEIHARSTWAPFLGRYRCRTLLRDARILHAWLQNLGHQTVLVGLVDNVKMKINHRYLDNDEAGGKLLLQVSWL
jgi:hypothetical protein